MAELTQLVIDVRIQLCEHYVLGVMLTHSVLVWSSARSLGDW